MLIILTASVIPVFLSLLLFPNKIIGIISIGVLMLLVNTSIPFTNNVVSNYRNNGINLNFGLARGVGSLSFALASFIVGRMVNSFGVNAIYLSGIILAILLIILILSMPSYAEEIKEASIRENNQKDSFFKKYPSFMLMFMAFGLLCTTLNMTNTYLLQFLMEIGGGSSELGTAFAIATVVEVPILFCFEFLNKKLSIKKLLLISSFGFVLKALGYALSYNVITVYLIQFFQILGYGIFASSSVYYVIEEIDLGDQSTGQALMASVMSIGSVLGSLIGGLIIDYFGVRIMLYVNVLIGIIGILMVLMALKKK